MMKKFVFRNVFWSVLILLSGTLAFGVDYDKYVMTSAFTYKFIPFVQWPERVLAEESIVICVYGRTRYNETFQGLNGRLASGKNVIVRRGDTSDCCHIAFIPYDSSYTIKNILQSLEGKPILTIGSESNFIASGGMVQFHSDQERLGFSINLEAVKKSGLHINARLLRIASLVTGRN